MGVMSVGILSLVLLIPVGVYELAEAAKLDAASTLGRAAFRDLEVRGYLRPETWVDTQWGMMIDADPLSPTKTYQNRLLAYPFLPPSVVSAYLPPPSYNGTVPSPPPPQPAQPQQWPQAFSGGNPTPPIGLPLSGPPWSGNTPFPPFSASDLPVMVLDPLLVGYTARWHSAALLQVRQQFRRRQFQRQQAHGPTSKHSPISRRTSQARR